MTDTVNVSRELLERCIDRWACCSMAQTPGAEKAWQELLDVVRAAPAVEPVAWTWECLGTQVTTDRQRAEDVAASGLRVVPLGPLQAAPPAIPPGYAIVPVEPTPQMLEEIRLLYSFGDEALKARYRAMLEAAPKGDLGHE